MKRLSVFARAASQPTSCCSRWSPTFDRCRRAISTTHTRNQRDDKSDKGKFDLFLPNGDLNPKYHDPRLSKKSLPEGWKKAAGIKEADELASEEESEEMELMRDVKKLADEVVDAFDGPGETNLYGMTREEMSQIERAPSVRPPERPEPGFFSLEEEKDDPGEDPEFNADDITSDGHGELEQHREMREFARVIAWDMPLLWHHRKEFEPPTTAKTPLRFRYTTYLGETHPASRKVVVDFMPSAFSDLSPVQLSKLIKLLGVRYNPSTENAKMSCEMFPTAAQNKRYLGDLVDKLIAEAKDGKNTFEDVPFDFRHHKFKKKVKFPEEWKMTKERRMELDRKRGQSAKIADKEADSDTLIDGPARIETTIAPEAQKEPIMVPAEKPSNPGQEL